MTAGHPDLERSSLIMITDLKDLIEDRNADGVPDYVNAQIYVADLPTPGELAAAANIAARLAFESLSIDLPLGFRISDFIPTDPSIAIVVGAAVERLSDQDRESRRILEFPDPRDAEAFALELNASHVSERRPRPEYARRHISLGQLFSVNALLGDLDHDLIPDAVETTLVLGSGAQSPAIIDLAARIALETTGLHLPLVVTHAKDNDLPNAMLIGRSNAHVRQLAQSDRFPLASIAPGHGRIEAVADAFAGHSVVILAGADDAGEDAVIRYAAHQLPYVWRYGKGESTIDRALELSASRARKAAPPRTIFEHSAKLPWELEDAERRIQNIVLPAVRRGASVDLELRLSEPQSVRDRLARKTRQALIRAGADAGRTHVRVLPAYKQGYGWIDEQLKPLLREASAIEIHFQETPAESRRIESTARWLHELYPIDEILARDLDIPVDRVTFAKLPAGPGAAYRLKARSMDGREILDATFSPAFVFRPMFDAFPEYATVRVTTGWLKATVDGAVMADEQIPTDAERFWDLYQRQILAGIRDCGDGDISMNRTLDVEVTLSEPDDRIGIDEERISPLEALHEDIYFETLLFFQLLGWKRPPRVIPRIRRASRKGASIRVRLTERQSPLTNISSLSEITAITVKAGKGLVSLDARDADGTVRSVAIPKRQPGQRRPASTRALQWETPIGPEECAAIVRRLGQFPEARAYRTGSSYMGAPMWAIDLISPMEGQYVSQAKASVTKPVLFITGRQHGNEVSSTTHILRFVELLATDPSQRKLLERVNVVVQPIANPDGAALTCALAKQSPGHMLHSGYYGALGVDIATDEWASEPPYPEGRARRELWQSWRPDVVLNPHGYPSHEWVQLFAGYTAWVRERDSIARDWWIPRGWFIPRFTYIEDARFPHHKETARAIRDAVATAAQKRISDVNERMRARYVKYATWDRGARAFPDDDSHGIGMKPAPENSGFMLRHPEVTVLELVTEIPDEVAHGSWMRLAAETGLECSLAAARFLAESEFEVRRSVLRYEDGTALRIARERPVRTAGAGAR